MKLAMRAILDLGWKLDAANETVGIVTFQTGISWGSWRRLVFIEHRRGVTK